jgi:hypothetical protein
LVADWRFWYAKILRVSLPKAALPLQRYFSLVYVCYSARAIISAVFARLAPIWQLSYRAIKLAVPSAALLFNHAVLAGAFFSLVTLIFFIIYDFTTLNPSRFSAESVVYERANSLFQQPSRSAAAALMFGFGGVELLSHSGSLP